MDVKLISVTPNAEQQIVEIARVSSSRKDKTSKPEGLINYLIRNNHWSPFEHGSMTLFFETSKAIGIQLIRHRSFTFQEFSQRYQDVLLMGDMFEDIELRRQSTDNRQSSTETFDPKLSGFEYGGANMPLSAKGLIKKHLVQSQKLYRDLLEVGVAREQARMVLPMCTKTRIYMTGTLRSWIHFFKLRDDGHAQKEIQLLAKEGKQIFMEQFPIISKALEYDK
jgi:thymidylate synthase (FAD)